MDEAPSPLGSQIGSAEPKSQIPAWLISLTVGMVSLYAAMTVPHYIRNGDAGKLTACKSNLKNISAALEMYRADHQNQLPSGLPHLVPDEYLKTIPECPSANEDTYSVSYKSAGDAFTVFCAGDYHSEKGCSPNHPQFSTGLGLLER